jgi:pSer/pThr/pTyr-binding forkhead associated (FHA) protein
MTCPYCDAEQRANQKTREPINPSRGNRRETRLMQPAPKLQKNAYVGEGDTRLIVGVLITYTWRPEGELFPVREGKNFIGSGDISSEAFHRSSDVQIPQDRRMSGEHALILCRHGAYEIIDQTSSNGTFLNGKMLRANHATEIPNYAKIQAGSTIFTFIQIEEPRLTIPAAEAPEERLESALRTRVL